MLAHPVLAAAFVGSITSMVGIEAAVRRHRGRRFDLRDEANSAAIGVGYLALKLVGVKALTLPAYLWVWSRWRLVSVDAHNPLWWLAAWIGADFVAYWVHRAEHRVAALWASHLVHHSSKDLTFTTAVRMPWTDVFYKPLIMFWAPLFGFHPAMMAVIGMGILATGQLQHTELIGRLGVFDRFLNTPSNHRVHHASNAVYLDRNFGATTVVWDRLFRTYQPELATERPVYGITHTIDARTPLAISLSGVRSLAARVRPAVGLWAKVAVLVGRPA
jgi:sterol desaturase/sphingolipid hydroxylase (fatty acid hydroxylase superfamily)